MNQPRQDQELPLVQHLIELRTRLLHIILFVLVIFGCLFYFANDIYYLISAPLQKLLPENSSMIATDVISPFLTPLKLTFFSAILLAIPFILYQVWAFIAPGLYKHEKRLAVPLLISSILLFYLGMAFAYFVVFPLIFSFITGIGLTGVATMTDITKYLDFVLQIFFAFGFAFEIPIATVLMIHAGIISPDGLAKKRPYIIVGCFIVGMLLTPPDVFSQVLLAVPMWMLFEVGIFFGRFVYKEKLVRDAESEAKDA
jgi:sec-independent protein translocase protein TatC